ncbi:MAG TPA: hypothetical protein VF796_01910 [Humisphaera sp.]
MPTSTTDAPADRAETDRTASEPVGTDGAGIDRSGTGPIKLHRVTAARRRDLAAATRVGPVRRKVGVTYPRLAMDPSQLAREIAAGLAQPPERQKQQVLDRVTDGLMEELGW